MDEVIAAYWTHLETSGRYMKDGEATSERGWIVYSLRPLSSLFGATDAASFGPKRLHALRSWMAEAARQETGRSLTRRTVNGRIRRIVRMFRWAASMELVPASIWHALQSVSGLRRGELAQVKESARVVPVAWQEVEAVLAHLGRVVAGMVQLQWFSGMRPGEVCRVRAIDIEQEGTVWVCRPSRHKTEHHGHACERLLGPKAQEVLAPFLQRDPQEFVFSPSESEVERNLGKRARRAVPQWPSHTKRYASEPSGRAGDCYSTESYRRAVQRACKKAGVAVWTPNQLRHARATEVRKRYGLEAAQVVLGHSAADVTQIYAARDMELARRVALETV